MAKSAMPVVGAGIPQPYPQVERDAPSNAAFGYGADFLGPEGLLKGNREPLPPRVDSPNPIGNFKKGGR